MALETHDGSSRAHVLGTLGGLLRAQVLPEEAVPYLSYRETGLSGRGSQGPGFVSHLAPSYS